MFLQFQRFLPALVLGAVFFAANPTSLSAVWQSPPTEFTETSSISSIAVASDANGHAFTIFNDSATNTTRASYYTGGAWQTPVVIGNQSADTLDVAMDATGTALVLSYNDPTGNIYSANFDGSNWTIPTPSPIATVIANIATFEPVSVSMNGPNQGAGAWLDFNTDDVFAAFFSSGTWTSPTTIGSGVGNVQAVRIAYSANGTAVAGWFNGNGSNVSNYVGGSWQPSINLGTGVNSGARVGIDANGIAHAVWLGGGGGIRNVLVSTYNGTSWSPTQEIGGGTTNNFGIFIGVAPNGTAVATWISSTGAGMSSSYNGTTWAAPIQYSAGPINNTIAPPVSVNSNGNALVVFRTTSDEIRSAMLPVGGVWGAEELIATASPSSVLDSSLSSNGVGFATWSILDGSTYNFFADATIGIAPPASISGRSCNNKFVTQSDPLNIITWGASSDSTVVSYRLYRNGVLIATIPSFAVLEYVDHCQCRGEVYVYTVIAVAGNGNTSESISVTIN